MSEERAENHTGNTRGKAGLRSPPRTSGEVVGRCRGLACVTDTAFGTQTWSWTYDSLDRIVGQSGPHGSISYTLDDLGRRTSMTATGQAPISYTYGPTDRITAISHNGLTATFEYDLLSRLTRRFLPNSVSTE